LSGAKKRRLLRAEYWPKMKKLEGWEAGAGCEGGAQRAGKLPFLRKIILFEQASLDRLKKSS